MSQGPNHELQRTVASCRGCTRRAAWPPSLSLGRFITTLVLLAVFVPVVAQAKRKAPPKVEPVIYEGVRYASPNDNGRRAYVQAWDTATNKMLWEVTVFRNFIVPFPEEDVQHVYIKKMSIRDGKLILVAEDERAYSIDLKTRAVKRLKQAPPETQANKSLQSTRGGALDSSRSRGLFYFAVPAWLSSSH